jgi:hypothetical protein
MNVAELKGAIGLCHKVQVPIMIWGHHGMGKSSIVRQVTQEMQIGFVDYRAAQIEATDLRGFPDKENGYTIYRPPAELPREGQGLFFLDELNRADDPVIQAAFQLIVERRIGTYELPTSYDDNDNFTGWSVVSAGNYNNGYHVNDFCKAFIGRFCHVELTMSEDYMTEWMSYVTNRTNTEVTRIIQFIGSDPANLCTREKGSLDFKIEPSPRLWEAVGRIEKHAPEFPLDVVRDVRAGLIGRELAIQYEKVNFEIEPKDILNYGVKPIYDLGREISRDLMAGLVWGVVSYIRNLDKKVTKAQVSNVFDFVEHLCDSKEKDMAIVLASQILKPQYQTMGIVIVANAAVADIMSKTNNIWLKEIPSRTKIFELTKQLMSKDETEMAPRGSPD